MLGLLGRSFRAGLANGVLQTTQLTTQMLVTRGARSCNSTGSKSIRRWTSTAGPPPPPTTVATATAATAAAAATAVAEAAPKTTNPLLKLVYWYVNTLDKYPLTVKMITSGVMYGLGDLLAQVVDPLRKKEQPLDWQRTGIFALYGTIIAGPLYHYWYGNLNQLPVFMMKTRRLNQHVKYLRFLREAKRLGIPIPADTVVKKPKEFSKRTHVLSKVLLDQLVFSPLYLVVFFYGTGLMRGQKFDDITEHTKEVFVPSYIADSVLWPVAQAINFSFVPVNLQPVYVNVLNVFWNAFLSYMANKGH